MKSITTLALLITFLGSMSVTGCTPVADPRQGGLFGYSPDLYEQRRQEREDKLEQVEAEGKSEQARSAELQKKVSVNQAEVSRLQAELKTFNKELMQLRSSIKKLNLETAEAVSERTALESQLKTLSRQSWNTGKEIEHGDASGKAREIAQLRNRLNDLMEEAELLGDL